MRKMMVIAVREYLAVVRTKLFLVSLILVPLMIGGLGLMGLLLNKLEDVADKRFAVLDRTPGHRLANILQKAAEGRNATQIVDAEGKQIGPRFLVSFVRPEGKTRAAMDRQRYELSRQVLAGEYDGFLEIGADVYKVPPELQPFPADRVDDARRLRYHSKTPQAADFGRWAEAVINEAIQEERWAGEGQPLKKVRALLRPAPLAVMGLTRQDPETGALLDAAPEDQKAYFFFPAALLMEMFILIGTGATPLVGSVLEEKMGRIAEVLLGSVRPFQLMAGKLLGTVGVSLTLVTVYLTGTYLTAQRYGFGDAVSAGLLAWFIVFLVLAVLLYGSLCIAIGAACTTGPETQILLSPVLMLAALPLVTLFQILRQPNSTFATLLSFFPPATPMTMIARLAVPPGIPWWQPLLGVLLMLAATAGCVYAAGRIFRTGILRHGKGARLGELVRWVFRG